MFIRKRLGGKVNVSFPCLYPRVERSRKFPADMTDFTVNCSRSSHFKSFMKLPLDHRPLLHLRKVFGMSFILTEP